MLQGRFEHNLDDKGRLAIPAPFRRSLTDQESTTPHLIITISDQCLAAYPPSIWQQKLEQIQKLNQLNPTVTAFKRIFIGCAQECLIDKAGRVLVPQDLRRDSSIVRECIIIGQIDKFEIWSKDRWGESFHQLTDQVGTIYASLSEHGIQL